MLPENEDEVQGSASGPRLVGSPPQQPTPQRPSYHTRFHVLGEAENPPLLSLEPTFFLL